MGLGGINLKTALSVVGYTGRLSQHKNLNNTS